MLTGIAPSVLWDEDPADIATLLDIARVMNEQREREQQQLRRHA